MTASTLKSVPDYFGTQVFNDETMRNRLPKDVYKALRQTIAEGKHLQKDIADVLGIQQTVYSRYERGFQTIPLELLIRLADYYHTSLDYLTGRSDER